MARAATSTMRSCVTSLRLRVVIFEAQFCMMVIMFKFGQACVFFFSSRRRHTMFDCDWSSDVCSSDLVTCPAFPSQGRVVVDRVLRVEGTAVAHVVDWIRSETDRPLAWVPLAEVRAGVAVLAARLARLAGTMAVADAETDGDLDTIVGAALALDRAPLLAGSAGLAQPLAERLGLHAERALLPGGRWLVVAGSRHPATRRQLTEARRAGFRVLATADAQDADESDAAVTLAREAAHVLATDSFDLIALAGGDTAVAFYRTLGAVRIDLLGAPRPGLAFGHVRAPGHPEIGRASCRERG